MANKIFHVGDVGCGNVAKLVNNMIGLACNSICAEGMVLGVGPASTRRCSTTC